MKPTMRDNQLPQLELVLNTDFMKYIFQKEFLKLHIEDCQIIQSRYKPERNCLVSYRLKVRDTATNKVDEQIVCARIFPEGESLSRFQKAQKQILVTPKFGNALTYLSDLEMVIWMFPNDRKLTGLPDLTNSHRLQTEILPSALGNDFTIKSLTSEIIHYVAEHTCTVKVIPELLQIKTGQITTPILYGKTYYNDEGAKTFQAMQQLHDQIQIAQPLAYQPEIKTLWQFGLDGKPLSEDDANNENLLAKAASAVAALHQAKIQEARTVTISEVLQKLQVTTALHALNNPSQQELLETVVERLIAQSANLTARPNALLHGDLHLKNFFVAANKVALIDLDNLAYGDPLQDIGSFMAGLWYRDAHRAQAQSNAFLRAYKNCVAYQILPSDLNWYIAAMLIAERVYRCISRLKSGRSAEQLIALADRISGGKQ